MLTSLGRRTTNTIKQPESTSRSNESESDSQLNADLNETNVPLKRMRGRSKGGKNRPHIPRMNTSDDEEEKELEVSKRPVGRPSFRPFDLRSKYPLKISNQASSDSESSFILNTKPAQQRIELYTRSRNDRGTLQ